jgi:hypothetical protein
LIFITHFKCIEAQKIILVFQTFLLQFKRVRSFQDQIIENIVIFRLDENYLLIEFYKSYLNAENFILDKKYLKKATRALSTTFNAVRTISRISSTSNKYSTFQQNEF